jgi:hypothetical protein
MTRQIHRIETEARVYGNSSHRITPKEWLGKKIVCILRAFFPVYTCC